MSRTIDSAWGSPQARRRLVVLGGSVVVHTAVLALIGYELVQTPLRPDPAVDQTPVFVELEPRPLLPGEVSRRSSRAHQADEDSVALPAARAASSPLLREEAEDHPSAPAPRLAAPMAGSPTGAASGASAADAGTDGAWTVRPRDMNRAMARSLRLGRVGCRTMEGHLSEDEQRQCDDAFNADAGRARPIGPRTLDASERARQEQFAREGAAAMARYERRRAPMRSGVGVVGASPECPGGNLRGTCPGANLPSHYQRQEEAPFGGTAGPK